MVLQAESFPPRLSPEAAVAGGWGSDHTVAGTHDLAGGLSAPLTAPEWPLDTHDIAADCLQREREERKGEKLWKL